MSEIHRPTTGSEIQSPQVYSHRLDPDQLFFAVQIRKSDGCFSVCVIMCLCVREACVSSLPEAPAFLQRFLRSVQPRPGRWTLRVPAQLQDREKADAFLLVRGMLLFLSKGVNL